MQVIVMFYRALIWFAAIVSLFVVALVVIAGFSGTETDSVFGPLSIVMGLAILVVVVLTLGASATLVSIHDRLVEIAERLDPR